MFSSGIIGVAIASSSMGTQGSFAGLHNCKIGIRSYARSLYSMETLPLCVGYGAYG